MKPEDILTAIGNVDDQFIRSARRKSLFTALLVFLLIAGGFCAYFIHTMPVDHLLVRYHPDFTVNNGYFAPEELGDSQWTSMEYTAYENGDVTATTRFSRKLYGDYTILHEADGESTELIGYFRTPYESIDYVSNTDFSNEYLRTEYTMDFWERTQYVTIISEAAYGVPDEVLNYVGIEYYEAGTDPKQQTMYRVVDENLEITGYKVFGYLNGRVWNTKEFDANDQLLAYSETTFDGSTATSHSYLADSTLTGYSVIRYDVFDRIKSKDLFSPSGELIGTEQYNYRPWELFGGIRGLMTLFLFIIPFSATFAVAIWSDRIKPGARLAGRGSKTMEILKEAKALQSKIDHLSQLPKDHLSDDAALDLTKEIAQLNETLSKLLDRQ